MDELTINLRTLKVPHRLFEINFDNPDWLFFFFSSGVVFSKRH